MRDGKKQSARKIVEAALEHVATTTKQPPHLVMLAAVANASPPMALRTTRMGTRRVKIPVPLTEEQRHNLGIRFIVAQARASHPKVPAFQRLAREILNAAENKGGAISKTLRISKEAENSRGNLYVKWD